MKVIKNLIKAHSIYDDNYKRMNDFRDDSGMYEAKGYEWIVRNPHILGGSPSIRGTRISPYSIWGRLRGGDTIEELFEDYPHLTQEMIADAVSYAQDHPLYPQR